MSADTSDQLPNWLNSTSPTRLNLAGASFGGFGACTSVRSYTSWTSPEAACATLGASSPSVARQRIGLEAGQISRMCSRPMVPGRCMTTPPSDRP